jgi:hypothetical protein
MATGARGGRRLRWRVLAMRALLLLAALVVGCGGSQEPTCDPRWDHCVESGLAVECVSNGAEALCTCQGTLDGRLVALACYQ